MNHESQDFIKFLKSEIEPLKNSIFGDGYRVAVYLTDGTYIPCLIFRNSKYLVNLAVKRFKEEQTGKGLFSSKSAANYYNIVKNFVATGNCINEYDIARIEKSRYAFPLKVQMQIQGETTMGWTGFVAKMKDGKFFGFGTNFRWEFFDLPENYSVNDIKEIINHSYVLSSGELRSHRIEQMSFPEDYKDAVVYREKPYFECYIDNL